MSEREQWHEYDIWTRHWWKAWWLNWSRKTSIKCFYFHSMLPWNLFLSSRMFASVGQYTARCPSLRRKRRKVNSPACFHYYLYSSCPFDLIVRSINASWIFAITLLDGIAYSCPLNTFLHILVSWRSTIMDFTIFEDVYKRFLDFRDKFTTGRWNNLFFSIEYVPTY